MKLHKNDEVIVNIGKDAGKKGKIEKLLIKENKILVNGLNIYKRHLKPKGQGKKGEIIDLVKPLPVANVSLVCPKCHMPTRIGYSLENKDKIRICRKCGQSI